MKWIFSQFLSATTESLVARVSAPRMTPSWGGGRRLLAEGLRIPARLAKPPGPNPRLTRNTRPAMVVPVLRA